MPRIEFIPDFLKTLPEIDLPIDGARGWLLQGADRQMVCVEFERTVEVPEHSHEDQWEIPVAGSVELRMNGETTVYRAGDSFFVPGGTLHGATVQAGYKALIVFDAADRYLPKA